MKISLLKALFKKIYIKIEVKEKKNNKDNKDVIIISLTRIFNLYKCKIKNMKEYMLFQLFLLIDKCILLLYFFTSNQLLSIYNH